MGTGYYDLADNDFQPSPEWRNSPEGVATLSRDYARKLVELADQFENNKQRDAPHGALRVKAGSIVIAAFQAGFLQDVPHLADYVAWHTASEENDPVVQAREARCPANLFDRIVGGGTVIYRLNADGSSTVVDPAPIDGILPGMNSLAFQRGDNADACRFLATEIQAEQSSSNKTPQATIPPERRSKAITKQKAALLLRVGNPDSGVKWLNKCIEDGTISCETLSRQSHVFDIQQFPESVRGQLLPNSR